MTNEELLAKIKEEFERRMKILREDEVVRQNCTSDFLEGKIYGYEELLSFLSTLESEHLADARKTSPKDLEEAANNYARVTDPEARGIDFIREVFIAGAEWQADHAPLPEDTVLFNKGVAEGRRLAEEEQADLFTIVALDAAQRAKEQMMKEAVEGTIDDCGIPARLRLEMPGGSFRIWDKVRVIVLPKEDEK